VGNNSGSKGDGLRNHERDRLRLSVIKMYKKIEEGEGVTWVYSKSFIV
jgi:hypothetical protein